MKFKPQNPQPNHLKNPQSEIRNPQSAIRNTKYEIVTIGASLGGLEALKTICSGISEGFPLPVVIVQHRSAYRDGKLLCQILQEHSRLPVGEVEDKEAILGGRIYIAPSDYHLLIEKGSFALSIEAPVEYARPAIDVMFESAADVYGDKTIGVVLTGANEDGASGVKRIKEKGGMVIVQDPATAESPVMPKAAIAAAKVDYILPLSEIAGLLMKTVNGE
ncbi:MAG: chemotaxis protein CheB [Nitrospirota bacterium]